MAASTFTGTRAAATFPVFQPLGAGALAVAYADYAIPETPEVGDVYKLFKLPKGAVPVGGYFAATDIDTGTETFDIDLGIAANGVDAADPDFFMNGGLFTGDAITDLPLTNAANFRPITFTTLTTLGAETTVQAVVNAVAAAGGTGRICAVVYYVVP